MWTKTMVHIEDNPYQESNDDASDIEILELFWITSSYRQEGHARPWASGATRK